MVFLHVLDLVGPSSGSSEGMNLFLPKFCFFFLISRGGDHGYRPSWFPLPCLSRASGWKPAAAHTLGFSHCSKFSKRIYSFSSRNPVDPTLNRTYAAQLQAMCPRNVDPRIAIDMDPVTPRTFDNVYFKNLQQGLGLFSSDQVLHTDTRSRPTVNAWAQNSAAFERAFVTAMTKLGRVGVKTGSRGNIRTRCDILG